MSGIVTEEGMSDVERDALVDLLNSKVKWSEFPDDIRPHHIRILIDTLAAAGVLGGVPGEKVTVDRGDDELDLLLRVSEANQRANHTRSVLAALWDDLGEMGRHHTDRDVTRAVEAALGGDGGTRPKGTQ